MQKSYKRINRVMMFTIVLIIFVVSLSHVSYGESDNIAVYIDNERVEFEINPILEDGRVLVPMRKIFEILDAKVTWEDETRSVYAERDNVEIKLTIDNNIININGEEVIMDTAPLLHKGTTLVPLRMISESYRFQVKWIPEYKEVSIITNPAYVKNEEVKLDVGMSLDELRSIMGNPSRIDRGQYDTEWYTYNNSPSTYKDYILVKVNEERVTGFQTNSKNWVLSDLIKINDKINENQFEVSFKDKHVASYYKLDIYGYNVENIINSFSIVEATPIPVWEGEYGEERIRGIERQIFDMTNVYRVNENLNSLTWNNMISNFAKNHSRDMNKNDYFAHDSLTQTFRDRIQPLLINGNWYQGGENLAYGYFDSIIVMNGWYNSEGHRQNLLYKDWKYHGVGVVITKSNKLYATKNFTQ